MSVKPAARYRGLLTVCCVLGILMGCRGTWEAFEEIEVGSPVPDGAVFRERARRGNFYWVWEEQCGSFVPAIGGNSSVRIAEDDEGKIAIKQYSAKAFGHWLVCQTAAWRSVLEVRVPEYAWHDPPNGWQPQSIRDWSRRHERALELSRVLEPLVREDPPYYRTVLGGDALDSLEAGISRAISAFPIARQRVAKSVLERIDHGERSVPVVIERDIDFAGLPDAERADWSAVRARVYVEDRPAPPTLFLEIAVPSATRRPRNALEWLLYAARARDSRLQREPGGHPQAEGAFFLPIFFPLYMFSHNGVIELYDLERMPELFCGVTEEGFDRTYTNVWGGTCRIQNLGGRRIRIETKSFDLVDPLYVLVYLKFALVGGRN